MSVMAFLECNILCLIGEIKITIQYCDTYCVFVIWNLNIFSSFPSIDCLLKTLRRKGLGLEGSELEHEDSMQTGQEKYLLNEGMDLSISRQRYYVSMVEKLLTHTNNFVFRYRFTMLTKS